MYFRYLFFCLLCLSQTYGQCQQVRYSNARIVHYDDETGLPQNSARELKFDKNGFLWIGTENGLLVFDGKNFFSPSGIDPTSTVTYSFYDHENNLYFIDQTPNLYKAKDDCPGLDSLYTKKSFFRTIYPSFYKYKKEVDSATFRLYFLTHFFGQNKAKIDEKGIHFVQNEVDFKDTSFAFFVMDDNNYKLCNNNKIYALNKVKNNIWEEIKIIGSFPCLPFRDQFIFCSDHYFFIFCNNKIFRLRRVGNTLQSEIYIDNFTVDLKKHQIHVATYNEKEDIMALGSHIQGIFLVTGSNFETYYSDSSAVDNGYNYPNVFYSQAVLPDNSIITGTGFKLDKSQSTYIKRIAPTYHFTRSLVFDDKKILVTIKDMRFVHIKTYKDGKTYIYELPKGYVAFKSFCGTESGDYYFATEQNIYKFDKNHVFTQLTNQEDFVNNEIRQLFDYSKDILWIVCKDGILSMNKTNSTITEHRINQEAGIEFIYPLDKDIYLMGTNGKGYYGYIDGKLIKMPLDKKEYLRYCHTFILDKKGFIWISTNKGLFQVLRQDLLDYFCEPSEEIYYHYYDKSYAFGTNEFNGRCLNPAISLLDGTLSFSSMNGLVHVNPLQIKPIIPDAPFCFTDIFIDSIQIKNKVSKLVLPPDFNTLIIKVSTPYFGHPNNLHIQYKLSDYNHNWQELNPNNTIKYGNIKYGNYVLQVRKKSGFGEGNYTYLNIPVTIKPYFYQTWWFMLCMVLAFIGIIHRFLLWYNRNTISQKIALAQSIEERTQELTVTNHNLKAVNDKNNLLMSVLIHDIKAPMKIVQNVSENIKHIWDKTSDTEKLEMINDVTTTTRNINHFMFQFINYIKSQKNEKLNYEHFNLKEIITSIFTFHDQNEKIKSKSITLVNQVPTDLKLYCEKQLIKIVLNNVIDNSIKFSNSCSIIVEAHIENEWVYIRCIDEGKGMSQDDINQILSDAYKPNSIRQDSYRLGYVFIKDILKQLKGEIIIMSTVGKGTTVNIRLPL